ncbi:hypothetical protein, partial [Rhizobium bangladeshense]|uniref:hypothetical protein n=1 Tax=Rhizobium bangladeshense TaxID=1138189 RepID=UPI001C83D585
RAYLCHRHLLFKGWLKQPNPSNQKRIMQIPSSKCRASGFVQSRIQLDATRFNFNKAGKTAIYPPAHAVFATFDLPAFDVDRQAQESAKLGAPLS